MSMNTLLKHKLKLLVSSAVCLLGVTLLVVAGGSGKSEGTAPAAPPLVVEVTRVEQRDVPIYSEWIGTTDGMNNAEIKAQVAGYLLSKNYTEGSLVRKGQLLFEIDPRPLQATLDQARGKLAQAQGQLAQAESQLSQAEAQVAQARGQLSQADAQVLQAEAQQGKTQLDANRRALLVKDGIISREEFDNAVQANLAARAQVSAVRAGVRSADAQVQAARAQVKTAGSVIVSARAQVQAAQADVRSAELNLAFTRIISPIDGIAGIARAQVGDLVSPSSDALTTVSTVNPIKVYFTLGEQEYLNFARRGPAQKDWDGANRSLELELVLADGTTYPERGRFFVADRQVDERTGAIRLAGIFSNPGNTLRPGQYGRVRAVTSRREAALLVPQRAVTELQGGYQVAVVGDDNKVSIRAVKVGERVETMWVIEDGLGPGETVVAEGTQKVRPGAAVDPQPFK
jgi:membrane fusion protein (multidrug efflux system)